MGKRRAFTSKLWAHIGRQRAFTSKLYADTKVALLNPVTATRSPLGKQKNYLYSKALIWLQHCFMPHLNLTYADVWWLTQHCRWSFQTEDRIQSDTLHKRTQGWIGWPQFWTNESRASATATKLLSPALTSTSDAMLSHLTAPNIRWYIHLKISQQCISCECMEHGRLRTYSWVRHFIIQQMHKYIIRWYN